MPRRVPARGRGRETELCIILSQGEVPKAEGVPLQESSVQFCYDVRDPLSHFVTAPPARGSNLVEARFVQARQVPVLWVDSFRSLYVLS